MVDHYRVSSIRVMRRIRLQLCPPFPGFGPAATSLLSAFLFLVFFKARYIFLHFQYATDGSNLLLITGPNMVNKCEIN